jgi:acyl-CoA-binding protein
MKTSNEQKLKFYSLYKQIKSGDNNTQAPSRFNFIEKAKWFFCFINPKGSMEFLERKKSKGSYKNVCCVT